MSMATTIHAVFTECFAPLDLCFVSTVLCALSPDKGAIPHPTCCSNDATGIAFPEYEKQAFLKLVFLSLRFEDHRPYIN